MSTFIKCICRHISMFLYVGFNIHPGVYICAYVAICMYTVEPVYNDHLVVS